ncbi:MAG: hypothetical protein WBM15_03160, partial [Chromatiaceae bacterium]
RQDRRPSGVLWSGGFDYVGDTRGRSRRLGPALWRALRLHQWAKYLLLFLPLLAAHQLSDGTPPARRRPRLPGLRAYRLRRLSG